MTYPTTRISLKQSTKRTFSEKQQRCTTSILVKEQYHFFQKFLNHSLRFAEHARHVEHVNDEKKLRGVNERIMMRVLINIEPTLTKHCEYKFNCRMERCFINPRGAPGSPANRHVFYAVSD